MELAREKFINPFTDFGFKRLFGEEVNKDILLDFLNELLREQHGTLTGLSYMKTEQFGRTEEERRAIFDIYCETERGEKILIEMQKTKQAFFKDRTVYYSTFPIQEQANRSDWDYNLNHIYTIGILDFAFDEDKKDVDKFRYDVKLSDIETKKVFYNKLTFIYLEMPKFTKEVHQLETRFEKWLYVLKNLHKLDRLPDTLRERVFEKVFSVAEISKMNKQEHQQYEDSLKAYRDLQNSLTTAKEEGRVEGRMEGRIEGRMEGEQVGIKKGELRKGLLTAVKCFRRGMSVEETADFVDLSVETISILYDLFAKHGDDIETHLDDFIGRL